MKRWLVILFMLFCGTAWAGDITVTWDASVDHQYLSTYRIYHVWNGGEEEDIDAGLALQYIHTGLPPGEHCYCLIAVVAREVNGEMIELKSIRTETVCGTLPAAPPGDPAVTINLTVNVQADKVAISADSERN